MIYAQFFLNDLQAEYEEYASGVRGEGIIKHLLIIPVLRSGTRMKLLSPWTECLPLRLKTELSKQLLTVHPIVDEETMTVFLPILGEGLPASANVGRELVESMTDYKVTHAVLFFSDEGKYDVEARYFGCIVNNPYLNNWATPVTVTGITDGQDAVHQYRDVLETFEPEPEPEPYNPEEHYYFAADEATNTNRVAIDGDWLLPVEG